MSAKMMRRRRHDRRKRILTHRREDALFFSRGEVPASATAFAGCCCGSRAFSRESWRGLEDWDEAHAYCEPTDNANGSH